MPFYEKDNIRIHYEEAGCGEHELLPAKAADFLLEEAAGDR